MEENVNENEIMEEGLEDESFPEKEEKRIYEVGYLIVPAVVEEELGERISYIKDAIEGNGGAIISEEWPKLKKLAYTMSQNNEGKRTDFKEGYFGWIKFELDSSAVSEVEEKLRANKEILRSLLIKTVREDTKRMPERNTDEQEEEIDKEREEISEEELDEAIDELVVE